LKFDDRHCERSEAIQGGAAVLYCFVASLLAVTMVVWFHYSDFDLGL
jgi:hypothetical protein